MTWPYPGDSPAARARRVAHAYRAALSVEAPAACEKLDKRMRDLGQMWVVPDLITVDEDQWLTPAQAADLACVDTNTIRQMRRRGIVQGRRNPRGTWEYRAGDIIASFARPRGRSASVTVTLHASGTTVPTAT